MGYKFTQSTDSPTKRTDNQMAEFELSLPFYIDTDSYSDRDRLMFVCGVEFSQVVYLIQSGWRGSRPIHRENESRIRMVAKDLGVKVTTSPYSDYETWSELLVE